MSIEVIGRAWQNGHPIIKYALSTLVTTVLPHARSRNHHDHNLWRTAPRQTVDWHSLYEGIWQPSTGRVDLGSAG